MGEEKEVEHKHDKWKWGLTQQPNWIGLMVRQVETERHDPAVVPVGHHGKIVFSLHINSSGVTPFCFIIDVKSHKNQWSSNLYMHAMTEI